MDAHSVFGFLIALYGVLEAEIEALCAHLGVQLAGHIPVQWRQHLLAALEHSHGHTRLHEVLRGLEADEAAAHHDDALGLLFHHAAAHLQRVLNGTQLQYAVRMHTRGIRHHGLRARGEYKFVVLQGILTAVGEVFDADGLARAVYGGDLAQNAHVYVEAFFKARGGLQGEFALVFDDSAHVIGQAAVGV